jgi:hypothetical protein
MHRIYIPLLFILVITAPFWAVIYMFVTGRDYTEVYDKIHKKF